LEAIAQKYFADKALAYFNTSLFNPPGPAVLAAAANAPTVQDVYGENYDYLRALRKDYDPKNVMKRAGGWIIDYPSLILC
jgi:hypothetical protein